MNGNRRYWRLGCGIAWALALVLLFSAAAAETPPETRQPLDYGDPQNWVYLGSEDGETTVDVFFIAPSAFGGKEGSYIMDLTNEKARANFTGVINMEKGIYDRNTRFYAPVYRQVGYRVCGLPDAEAEPMMQSAFADVKDAFIYYMEHWNGGRPFILAGFSQGADMAIRLMKDCFGDETLQKQLIACYAIGWRLTEEETAQWPQLRAAQGEKDTGVIISFNTEAEEVGDSIMIPAGTKTLAINPLNWKTDGELAGKEMNLGACFTDYDGNISDEVPELTGAYLDAERGALKVTDIDPEVYNATLSILAPGVYHVYDYQFFYRNLEKNVQDRIQAYLNAEQSEDTLDRVVILSRHNIRSPLSGSGSLLGDITPHEWFQWTSNPSELSLRGAVLETLMGQYFRLWLEQEGLFPENYQPEEGAVRFYANAKQRTIATARYFSAGLLPVAAAPIETHVTYDTMDPVFEPSLNFVTEEYMQDAIAQIAEKGGEAGLDGILSSLNDAISLLMDTADIEQSEAYQAGKHGDLKAGETVLTLETGKEPKMTGPIKNATSVADAMILQYYEEPDKQKAAFGHDLTDEDWRLIHSIVDTYSDMLFCSPLVSVNVAHPLLEEIRAELSAEGRKFSFLCGHDANVASVLAALNYGDYLLPETVEQHTPIGVKLEFERWVNAENEAYYKISLVYQSTAQLRSMEQLTLESPPVVYPLHFEGMDEDGRIAEADLFKLLDGAIFAYDALVEQYTAEETLDDAA